jgi:hypothetical protein
VVPASSPPCVLIVADPERVAELAQALRDPLPQGPIDVLESSGGDDTIEIFAAKKPRVVVLTAGLDLGDADSLIETLRSLVPRDELIIVLVGDDETGPIRTGLDAMDMKPDRFVSRPLSGKALRFAVGDGLAKVARALGETAVEPALQPPAPATQAEAELTEAELIGNDRMTKPMGSRTSTPVRGSGEPRRSIPPTADLAPLGPNQLPDATVASLGPNLPPDPDAPAFQRTPTLTRGSAATMQGPAPIEESPFVRTGTAPRFSQPVEAGDLPAMRPTPRSSEHHDVPPHMRPTPRFPDQDVPPHMRPTPRSHDQGDVPQDHGDNGEPETQPVVTRAKTDRGTGISDSSPAIRIPNAASGEGTSPGDARATRAALRARWEALADSIGGDEYDDDDDAIIADVDDITPLPPVDVQPRRKSGNTNREFTPVPPVTPWRPGTTELPVEPEAPPREPTLILNEEAPLRVTPPPDAAPSMPLPATPSASIPPPTVAVTERSVHQDRWSQPVLLSELIDRSRDSSRELLANVTGAGDLASLEDLDDDIIVGHPVHTPPPHVLRGGKLQALEDLVEPAPPPEPPARPSEERLGGRDFARQLRAKMSMMAQRLFQGDGREAQPSLDVRPRHDHSTEIDLSTLGDEPALGGGVTEIGRPALAEPAALTTSPGSWDTQVRERGLPDSGEIVRGVSDAAMILARMFAITFTGRVGFRKDDVEKVVYFDQGRPVFASSNEPGDRMGELLVREGKITASQYERCQVVVAQSGRRMGEILVDFGYLKRRELLPAVRRHVEDIVYSLFGWDRGHYHVTSDVNASAERIRLSRHPASLVLEGIRRKLDRTTLEKVLGPASTVIEVPDRERLGGILNTGDLAAEERTALTAFDGQADLAAVARVTAVDIADVLPLAWGLCVLGLANARRAEVEIEESTALVGETDLAIDRERVRARWQLVTEADYFALLGVRRDATAFEIRRAYQSARRDFAPDGFPTDLRRELARELEDIASVLDEAFRVLRDDRLRNTYLSNLIE